jgi:hypothetical protein
VPIFKSADLHGIPNLLTEKSFAIDLLADSADKSAFMREGGVVVVDKVLELKLPVTGVFVLLHPAPDLDLTARRAIQNLIEIRLYRREELLQALALGTQTGEYEAAIAPCPRKSHEAQGLEVEIRRIAAAERDSRKRAVVPIGPTVIDTTKVFGVARLLTADDRAAVHAAIVHHIDIAVFVSAHDNGLPTKVCSFIISGTGHLGLVTDEGPRAIENTSYLFLKKQWIGVHAPVYPILLHQILNVIQMHTHRGLLSTEFPCPTNLYL